MQNHTKILILLMVPTFWVGMHFFPKEMGYFTHPIKRYLLLGVYLFPFILLPYLASRKYNFNLREFLKTFFIMFFIFILYLGIMFGIFGDYRGVPPREGFIIPILVFMMMIVCRYRYAHYFFFLLLFTMATYVPERYIVGHFFYLSFGVFMFITLYTFYFIYVLSEQYLNMKHRIALLFSFSYTLVALGCFLVDMSQIYVRKLDVVYWLKKYANYETFLFTGITMSLLGLYLFVYGVYSMYEEKQLKKQL